MNANRDAKASKQMTKPSKEMTGASKFFPDDGSETEQPTRGTNARKGDRHPAGPKLSRPIPWIGGMRGPVNRQSRFFRNNRKNRTNEPLVMDSERLVMNTSRWL